MDSYPVKPSQGPALYGIAEQQGADPFVAPKRRFRRTNVSFILLSLVLPVCLFALVFFCLSFSMGYNSPSAAWFIVAICFLVVFGMGIFAGVVSRANYQGNDNADPLWPVFLFLTSLAMCIVAAILANRNFARNMRPYYDIQQLNAYTTVNPDNFTGQQMMDAGRIHFTEGVHVDPSKSMGFRNKDTYCVAPITGGSATDNNYDFWAVGTNCCFGSSGASYHCGEYNNPSAHSGLRLMDDEKRSYFRLAVEQAAAAYNINSAHPVFMYFMQDPDAEIQAYQSDGQAYFLTVTLLALAAQVVCVIAAVFLFSKLS